MEDSAARTGGNVESELSGALARYEPVVARQIMVAAREIAAQLLLHGNVLLRLEGEAEVCLVDPRHWTVTTRTGRGGTDG